MNFRFPRNVAVFPPYLHFANVHNRRRLFSWYVKHFRTTSQARASLSGGGSSNSNSQGEIIVATFLRILPLRSISRAWGFLMSVDIPVWLRPHVYRAWARAFHSNLEEAALPLEEYASLRDFFVRTLKEGCRPINPNPYSLVSPVDGTILRFGKLNGAGAMIDQVKGFSYSVSSLLGASPLLSMLAEKNTEDDGSTIEQESTQREQSKKSWWHVSLAAPKVRETISECFISGSRLFPVNERATRTIRNLYVENERVVLEGLWQQGFMAIAAVGATNIGSIELFIEPELRTNRPRKKLIPSEPPEEHLYEPKGVGVMLKKGDEVRYTTFLSKSDSSETTKIGKSTMETLVLGIAAFNMGSTVVLVFQAPTSKSPKNNDASEFEFSIRRGDKIRVGEVLGIWHA
ncbi:Phosphatidylserine decarboxylase proenzyme 1, mitochondrial [Gossypium australe]|uniref:phosphatidylserine decarboxylase n=1 Tax=Gossypium australe TaxID=47621 RepID=A0A5B6UIV1_9ROSI|nr:Phosphatidylserine decarboxylase proenzyme 1, mitochondrial [Gossypium australe]